MKPIYRTILIVAISVILITATAAGVHAYSAANRPADQAAAPPEPEKDTCLQCHVDSFSK